MAKYRVIYTMFVELEADSEEKAIEGASEIELDDFILLEVESEEIN